MDYNLAVQESVLMGILAKEPNVQTRSRLEALITQVRLQQLEAREGSK